jgi:hypothetical protein
MDAWPDLAAKLARWARERLVNRTDVWGGYNAILDRGKIVNGKPLGDSCGCPAALPHDAARARLRPAHHQSE